MRALRTLAASLIVIACLTALGCVPASNDGEAPAPDGTKPANVSAENGGPQVGPVAEPETDG